MRVSVLLTSALLLFSFRRARDDVSTPCFVPSYLYLSILFIPSSRALVCEEWWGGVEEM